MLGGGCGGVTKKYPSLEYCLGDRTATETVLAGQRRKKAFLLLGPVEERSVTNSGTSVPTLQSGQSFRAEAGSIECLDEIMNYSVRWGLQ